MMFTLLCASPGRSFIRIIALKRGTSYPGGWHASRGQPTNFSLLLLLFFFLPLSHFFFFFFFCLSLFSVWFEVAPASVFARKFSLRALYERAKIRASFPRFFSLLPFLFSMFPRRLSLSVSTLPPLFHIASPSFFSFPYLFSFSLSAVVCVTGRLPSLCN